MPDQSQRARAIMRAVRLAMRPLSERVDSLVELVRLRSTPGSADTIGDARSHDGEGLRVLEPYGLASRPPAGAVGLALEPGANGEGRVVVALIAPGGRPSTAAGDVALWTAAGHKVHLQEGGGVTVESASGSTIVLDTLGNVSINVGVGNDVKIGGPSALDLLKAVATESFLISAANSVTGTPDVEAGFTAFAAALLGLADAAKTTKAKGE